MLRTQFSRIIWKILIHPMQMDEGSLIDFMACTSLPETQSSEQLALHKGNPFIGHQTPAFCRWSHKPFHQFWCAVSRWLGPASFGWKKSLPLQVFTLMPTSLVTGNMANKMMMWRCGRRCCKSLQVSSYSSWDIWEVMSVGLISQLTECHSTLATTYLSTQNTVGRKALACGCLHSPPPHTK